MSEGVTPTSDSLTDAAPDAAPSSLPAAVPVAHAADPSLATALAMASPGAHTILETLIRGLEPDADESTRAAARELCAQAAQSLAAAAPVARAAAVQTPVPAIARPPTMPATPLPTSPITMAARELRQLPPDQLLDLLLQRLRAALPAGASVPAPRGIQFQLVPMTPAGSR
jgi:hypothetical protein